jgi:hypothetical protein
MPRAQMQPVCLRIQGFHLDENPGCPARYLQIKGIKNRRSWGREGGEAIFHYPKPRSCECLAELNARIRIFSYKLNNLFVNHFSNFLNVKKINLKAIAISAPLGYNLKTR